mgnify:CR=1 FL=1
MELIIGREAGASRLRISINNQDRFWGNANSVPKSVSRQHCKVVTDDKGGYIITNLKPENVTYVNGVQIESKHISGKDRIDYKRAGSINTQIVLYPSPTRSMGRISRHQTPDTDKRKEVCSNPFCNRRIFHVCHFLRIYSGHCRPAGFACHSIFCRTFIGHLFLCDNLPVIFHTSQVSGRP